MADASPRPKSAVTRMWRSLASLAIALHLFSVLLSPLAFLVPSLQPVNGWFRPWQQATYSGHGYQFFAPDPGPNHHVGYRVALADGQTIEGKFPDRDQHWPRLHYHRWFMLAEQLYLINSNILPADELETLLSDWQQQIEAARAEDNARAVRELTTQKQSLLSDQEQLRQQSMRLTGSLHAWLQAEYPTAENIELWCAERLIPYPYQVLDQQRGLDDPMFLPESGRIELQPLNPQAEEIGQ